jgi:hypothetical protein
LIKYENVDKVLEELKKINEKEFKIVNSYKLLDW